MNADRTAARQRGAAAFRALIARLGDMSETACVDADPHLGDSDDMRDYLGMSEAVAESLTANLTHTDPLHREGYLRAVTSLLALVADGCGPSEDWDPLGETAAAFDAPGTAAELLERVSRVSWDYSVTARAAADVMRERNAPDADD